MKGALMPSDPWVPLIGFLCRLCWSFLEYHVMCYCVWLLLCIFFFWVLSHVINMCTSTSTFFYCWVVFCCLVVPQFADGLQFSSVAQSCPTLCDPWTAARQAPLSITNPWSLLRFMSIESVMPSNHLILCCPLQVLCYPFLLLPSTILTIY